MKKALSIILALTILMSSLCIFAFAEDEKNYYYIDSIDGNIIDSVNIGCYGGTGAESEYQPEGLFGTIIHEIVVIFD